MSKIANYKAILYKMLLVGVIVILSFAALTQRQPRHAYGSSNGRIAYVHADNSSIAQIYSSNADGSDEQQLTHNSFGSVEPSWSPDGSKIVFAADPNNDGNVQIFVMYADGTDQVNLTSDNTFNIEPKWSPDGAKLAFTHADDNSSLSYIYTMDANGSNRTKITNGANGDMSPAWNPNGMQLLYTCPDGTYDQLCLVNADGASPSALTSDAQDHDTGAWSPDGTQIAFTANIHPYDHHLTVMDANGSNMHTLSSVNYDNRNVGWSPDGTKLIYDGFGGGSFQRIYGINTDGSNETAITPDTQDTSMPSWQIFSNDNDGDGIANATESNGPNHGDANGDGITDTYQRQITSLVNPITNNYQVLQSDCTANSGVSTGSLPASYKDTAFSYPEGLTNFTLTCAAHGQTATVTLYYYGLADSNTFVLRKYNTTTHTYQTIPGAIVSSATIGGQTLTKITYQITDGGPLDQDGAANGTIVDPVGIASPAVGAPSTGLGGTPL